jgi:hypothetical protein
MYSGEYDACYEVTGLVIIRTEMHGIGAGD